MSDILGLGASGVRGYSRALQTISDNIANAQTPGYARRNTVLAEQVGSGQQVLYRAQVGPNGVIVNGVGRAVDPWLIDDARAAGSDAARSSARLKGLDAAETAIGDGGQGVGKALTAFFNRADELAADPSDAARRGAFLQSVDDVAATFRRTAEGLSRAGVSVAGDAMASVDRLNTDINALARINDGLRRARDGSTNQATLLDERDRLVDSISASLDVSVSYEPKGAAILTIPGGTLLSGAQVATVSATVAPDGRVSLTATASIGSFAITPRTGTLSGQVAAADHIATLRSDLDTQANAVATSFNAQHTSGRNASGLAGANLFTTSTGASDISAVALALTDIAAADTASTNGNALAFGNLRGANGSEADWAAYAALQSQLTSSVRAQDAAADSRRDAAAEARADTSGVDLDREAADLVRYQQAYDASARVIQVAREMMQSILNAF